MSHFPKNDGLDHKNIIFNGALFYHFPKNDDEKLPIFRVFRLIRPFLMVKWWQKWWWQWQKVICKLENDDDNDVQTSSNFYKDDDDDNLWNLALLDIYGSNLSSR